MLPYKRMLGLTTKVASIATMRYSCMLRPFTFRSRWFATTVGASLAGRHKVRMPVRVGDNETGKGTLTELAIFNFLL